MRHMTADERRELGQNIKSARKQKGLSQEQLADLVGYKVGTISKYEQGYRMPDIIMLRKIASALECNISEIAGAMEDVIVEESRFEEAAQKYIDWLRCVGIMVGIPLYHENDQEKNAIIVDIDNVPLDIENNIDDIATEQRAF